MQPGSHRRRKSRILFVDDTPAARRQFAEILRHAGLKCDAAASAVEALAFVRHRNYDVVVVDLWMPKTDGPTLIAQLAQRLPLASFLAVTEDRLTHTAIKGPSAVADLVAGVIHKPWTGIAVLTSVQDAITAASSRRSQPRISVPKNTGWCAQNSAAHSTRSASLPKAIIARR